MASLSIVIRRPMYGTATATSYTGTAGTTAALPASAKSVLVWLTTIGYVKVGGTATTADLPLPANAPIIIPIDNKTAQGVVVSAVQAASGGTMYCIALAD